MTMPDYVCTDQTRQYYVIPGYDSGSTFKWWIDGVLMSGFTDREFTCTWNIPKSYLLDVQEFSADGCPGKKKSGMVYVNPPPDILIRAPDAILCNGESVTITVQNPVNLLWGRWKYDLIVEPDEGITGNSKSGTFTGPADLVEKLFNNDVVVHKVIYRFTPGIAADDGRIVCQGKEVIIILWVQPEIRYYKEVSDYNGYSISCSGADDGFIRIDPDPGQAPYAFRWSGPDGYFSKFQNISGLSPGRYNMSMTGRNGCIVAETFELNEPEKLELSFEIKEPSCPWQPDGEINVTVSGGVTGGGYSYRWSDNSASQNISGIPAGLYGVTVTDINGCQAKDTVRLYVLRNACLSIPEAFSPDGDMINDVWKIGNSEMYPSMEITIYNRWGQMVWKSERGYPEPWDGTSGGKKLPIDSYHYVIELHEGAKLVIGDITIVR